MDNNKDLELMKVDYKNTKVGKELQEYAGSTTCKKNIERILDALSNSINNPQNTIDDTVGLVLTILDGLTKEKLFKGKYIDDAGRSYKI